jgi:hypothetical protein
MKTFHLFIAFALLIAAGCKDSDSEKEDSLVAIQDPSQHILGKWREIACGNSYYPELTPTYHVFHTVEFLPDGIYYGPYGFHRGQDDGKSSHYRIESDSLYLVRESDSNVYIYRYLFTGKNQLLADYIYGGIEKTMTTPSFHIFERIK